MKSYCIDCNKKLGNTAFWAKTKRCRTCAAKERIKINGHPMFGKHHTKSTKLKLALKNFKHGTKHCIDCNKDLRHYQNKVKRCNSCAKKYQYMINPKTHPWLNKFGINAPNYIHGNGKMPYPLKFNRELKDSIRKRDDYKCQNCGMTEKEHKEKYNKVLTIHHIDYNKHNCKKDNLITVCNKCNVKANSNRDYWYAFFTYILKGRQ